jgi:hypothetical protein
MHAIDTTYRFTAAVTDEMHHLIDLFASILPARRVNAWAAIVRTDRHTCFHLQNKLLQILIKIPIYNIMPLSLANSDNP